MSDEQGWVLPYPFPPGGGLPNSPGVLNIIPSYLYDEYSDDDDLQSFITGQNNLVQQYLDWFNNVLLPIYTDDNISGLLLNWVGAGLYGYPRPTVLLTNEYRYIGAYGTVFYGEPTIGYAMLRRLPLPGQNLITDDIYKRILTWHFYKGDGKYFGITWLKKRIMRFLIGVNGTAPNIDETYRISITFGPNRQANITIYNATQRVLTGPGVYGQGKAYGQGPAYGFAPSKVNAFTPPFTAAVAFKACVDQGVLELPFQWTWTVRIL